MMIYPPIAKLVEKTGSRYTLVIEAAKRARQLSEGSEPMCHCDSNKEVSIATNEIFEGKLTSFEVPGDVIDDTEAEFDAVSENETADIAAEDSGDTEDSGMADETGDDASENDFED